MIVIHLTPEFVFSVAWSWSNVVRELEGRVRSSLLQRRLVFEKLCTKR